MNEIGAGVFDALVVSLALSREYVVAIWRSTDSHSTALIGARGFRVINNSSESAARSRDK